MYHNLSNKNSILQIKVIFNCLTLLVLFLLCSSCNLFSPRQPENPLNSNNNFLPPTSAQAVISNFVNSYNCMSVENFVLCLSDSRDAGKEFSFIPSSETFAQYQSIFEQWNIQSERRYFNNLILKIEKETAPNLTLSKEQYSSFTDSTIYSADYNLTIKTTFQNAPKQYNGNIRLTLEVNQSGNWYIRRWYDIGYNSTDSLKYSWSKLKAIFN